MPHFLVYALDAPGKAEARLAAREAHRERLRKHDAPLEVQIGGPLLDKAGQMCGSMLVIEAEDEATVRRYLDADSYSLAGVYESVQIHRFNWGLGQPEASDG